MNDEVDIRNIVSDLFCTIDEDIFEKTLRTKQPDRAYVECYFALAENLLSWALLKIEKKDWESVLNTVKKNAVTFAKDFGEMPVQENAVDNSHLH